MQEHTGQAPDEDWHKSIICQMLDPQSLTQMMIYEAEPLAVFKRKVIEFAAAMTVSSANGQVNHFGEKQPENGEEQDDDWNDDDWDGEEHAGGGENNGQLNGFGEKLHNCGGCGPCARECPSKGKTT